MSNRSIHPPKPILFLFIILVAVHMPGMQGLYMERVRITNGPGASVFPAQCRMWENNRADLQGAKGAVGSCNQRMKGRHLS